jgi:hypothetical protein
MLLAGYLLGLFFNPEDGGSMFLWNSGELLLWTTQCYIPEDGST